MRGRSIASVCAMAMGVMLAGGGSAWAQAKWEAPAAEAAKKNPVARDAKSTEQGKKVSVVNCASCHGAAGKGDGAAAAALNPKPADWTSKAVQDQSDGTLFWKISNGRGGMPPWKHLPENDRWALVNYIRSLKK